MSDQDTGGFESPARGGPRLFPEFDGLRALAATGVLVAHAGFLSGVSLSSDSGRYLARAEVGVPVFFAISGFLLYRPLARAHLEGHPGPRLLSFWRRRASRIFPAYWVALTFLPVLTGDAIVHGAGDVIAYYGLMQVYDADRVLGGLPQAWSLCTELGFYLLLPLVAGVVARGARSMRGQLRAEAALVAVLYAVSLGFRATLIGIGHEGPEYTWTVAWLDVFALGMGLAVVCAWGEITGALPRPAAWASRHPGLCWLAAGAAFVMLSHLGIPRSIASATDGQRLAGQALGGVVAVGLLAPAVFGPAGGGWLRRILRSRGATAVGLISYSVYLWHLDLLEEAVGWVGGRVFDASLPGLLALGGAATLAVATLSYLIIERPASAAGERVRGRAPA